MDGQLGIHPVNNHALVEIAGMYKNVAVPVKKYDSYTSGKIVEVAADEEHINMVELLGHTVYWDQFKEGKRLEKNGVEYCFIKLDDIQGFEDV